MAPSSDKENKYKDWTLEELKAECEKRKIEYDFNATKDNLINLLIEDDKKPSDWGQIYCRILYHTGMPYEEIARRTLPQIKAILGGAEENIPIKIGIPGLFGTSQSTTIQKPNEPPKVSQFAEVANMFSCI